ncbi:LysR family transcriptional regulator [Lujinxingia vulgaris]|uniref:LysR family transcriptional regulator n=1 Tax=Lujinxingia vulgaris TaxID=2600176 RepID=A0A5C6XH74_9DELT|nr:LysR family transcriptional regulator [Lujinxingia vulgaris]TXD37502.1 LysR family transcriptional regulator [Lujinxingia vulgaris]
MNLTDLQTFVVVAETETMSAAADELGVPRSTVSRRVARLEEALGVTLVHRSNQGNTLSADGRHLYARSAPAIRELSQVERALADTALKPTGILRLTAPHDFGAMASFAELMTRFEANFPDIELRIELTNRVVDLVEEGFDAAIRAHGPNLPDDAGLMIRPLTRVERGLYASPAYLKQHGRPSSVDELAEHRFVAHQTMLRERNSIFDPHTPRPIMRVNDFGLVVQLLIAGAGIGEVPTFFARDHVRAGLLQRVLPEVGSATGRFSLFWPASRHLAQRIRALIDFLSAEEHVELLFAEHDDEATPR